jgi:hypothetical protein
MKKIITAAALVATLAVPALAATDDELKQALVGSWGDEESCQKGRLVFNADGSFTSGSADDPADVQKGTYTIANGKLNGSAGDATMPEMTITLESGVIYLTGDGGSKDRLYACPAAPAQ